MRVTEPIAETDRAIRLVLGVARLGEQGLRGWWRSHGLGKGGQYVLTRSFPRTWRAAALELDILSAAYRHDDLLERSTALHLFSSAFPFRRWAEAWLSEAWASLRHRGIEEVELVDLGSDQVSYRMGLSEPEP